MGWGGGRVRGGAPRPSPLPPPQLTLCPGTYLRFFWQDEADTSGVTQVAGDSCDFGAPALDIAPPTRSGDVTVKLDAPGVYYFACPVHCAKDKGGLMQEVEVVSG